MENIEEIYCHLTEINLDQPTTERCFDYSDGIVCEIHDNNLILYQEGENNISNHSIDVTGKLKYVKYLSIFNVVFLGTENELVLYDNENKTKLFTLTVESPMVEMSWNPLETLLVVVHENLDITSYICTRHFIEIKDKSHLSANVPVPILSGWGSIYTQFQGPKKTKKITPSQEDIQSAPTGPPRISWRGNSELFVVNYYSDNQRYIKVFDADLNALNQSEPYTNLQDAVAFMGQGQCIACVSTNEEQTKLVIFEKNCKVKGEYDLPDVKGVVTKLLYHPQMNLLAVSFIDQEKSFINMYLYSNGRWFFKQQLYYPPEHRIYNFQWISQDEISFTTCKLAVFTYRNIEYRYFRFVMNRRPNTATTAVIDGTKIDFNLFDKKIIPPPFCYYSFENETPVNRISFHPTRNICALIDAFFHIKLLRIKDDSIEEMIDLNEHKFSDSINFHSLNWDENQLELIVQCKNSTDTFSRKNCELEVHLKTEKFSSCIYLPYSDTNLVLPYKLLDFNRSYIYVTKHLIDGKVSFEYALSAQRDFFVNDVLVCSGVTSIYVFKNYLMFTHSNSKLYCIRLKDYPLYTNEINLNTVFHREIEQGAVIVACTNLISPQIILQLPRGNIETISCKMITIDVVEEMLEDNKWTEVLQILRIEKVNWNVLIDLNPVRFRSHIEDFVRASKNNAILTNITTDFNLNENCFQTFYKNYWPFGAAKLNYDKQSIVEDILYYLVSTDCINNLPSIVAIQHKHISLKSALKSIRDVFNSQNESVCCKVLKQLSLQEHFKDVENAAYNLFDLEFLSLIYRNSMEDPKIYEPEIRALRSMSEMERKFRMCVRGRNLGAAVKYLLRWEAADEEIITNFIVKNHLEDVAYLSIRDFHEHFKLITILYAKNLSMVKKYEEAGMILKRAGLYQEALLEFKKGLDWREVAGIITKLNYESDEAKKILNELAVDLVKVRKIGDAVILLETYIKDYKTAINVLVETNFFRKAINLAETYRENNLVETEIIPKLIKYMSLSLEKINNYSEQFEKYANRLETVREERIFKLQRTCLGICEDQDDLYSDASSQLSSVTKSTSRSRGTTLSSKNRRKEERKKIDCKEGGFYEDIALIRALHTLYCEVINLGEEIKELCLAGYEHDVELTTGLHKSLCELQDRMVERIPKIWSDIFVKKEESMDIGILAIIQNKQDLDPEFRHPPPIAHLKSWRLELFL